MIADRRVSPHGVHHTHPTFRETLRTDGIVDGVLVHARLGAQDARGVLVPATLQVAQHDAIERLARGGVFAARARGGVERGPVTTTAAAAAASALVSTVAACGARTAERRRLTANCGELF